MDQDRVVIPTLLGASWIVLGVSIVWGIVYRLYFSPIAKFPGPKIAAVTFWYEFYYETVLKGRYVFKIKEMHKKYGPVVRINPYELHVADAEFYSVLYTHTPPRDKHPSYLSPFGFPESSFGTRHHQLHRLRRGTMNPFFSRGKILKQEPLIQQLVQQLCGRIKEMLQSDTVVPLSLGYTCLTTDLINSFVMDRNYQYLSAPDLLPYWGKTLKDASEMATVTKQITWVLPILKSFPQTWAEKMNPGLKLFYKLAQRSRERIQEVITERESGTTTVTTSDSGHANSTMGRNHTLIDQVLDSKLSQEDKTADRIEQEIRSAIGAGTETTSNALTVITYNLLTHPDMLQRVQSELRELAPDPDTELSLKSLESLTYLTSVILEGLRLSYGVSTRLQRVAREPLSCGGYVIPPGTVIGMSSLIQNHDEGIFPDSHKFVPERWVDDGNRKYLDKYMASFSKGSRRCIGMNLALAELHLVIGTVFHRFEFELHNTTADDIEAHHDVFIPRPKNVNTIGVQVTAKQQ